MPYEIQEMQGDPDGEFCVMEGDKKVKCHKTEEEAQKHMAALYANVSDANKAKAPNYHKAMDSQSMMDKIDGMDMEHAQALMKKMGKESEGMSLEEMKKKLKEMASDESTAKQMMDEMKAVTDAPNLRGDDHQKCANCKAYQMMPAEDGAMMGVCTKHDFVSQDSWVCDDWEVIPPATDMPMMMGMMDEGKTADTLVAYGCEVKALKQIGDKVEVGGYLIRFGDENSPDISEMADWFHAKTNYGKAKQAHTWFHHCLPVMLKGKPVRITREFEPAELTTDQIGVFAKTVLDERDVYEQMIAAMVKAGKIGWSSGTANHLVKRTPMPNGTNRIDQWILGDDASFTHTPAEPRNSVSNLKAVKSFEVDAQEPEPVAVGKTAATAEGETNTDTGQNLSTKTMEMTEMEETKTAEQTLADEVKALKDEVKAMKEAQAVNEGGVAGGKAPTQLKTPRGDNAFKAFNWFLQTGDPSGIRTGDAYAEHLKTDYHLVSGTQYQGQEAVPTEVYNAIVSRRDPLSIARAAGALVIPANSNAMNIPIEKTAPQAFGIVTIDGSNSFTTLTTQPLDKLAATVYMFTYNIPFAVNLLDDASFDVEGWASRFVGRGLAITENTYLLMGTGSGQPQGAIYASTKGVDAASATTVTAAEVVSLYYKLASEYRDNVVWMMRGATEGTVRGLGSSNFLPFLGNGGAMGGAGNSGFPQGAGWLVDPKSRVFNSDAVDALGASGKSIAVGNLEAGYAIVERKGLTILRDPYSEASKGIVNVWFYSRFSGGVTNAVAIQHLLNASA